MSEKVNKYLTPVVALFFATALGVTAATTIGTDIVTEGNLEVLGNATTSGDFIVEGDWQTTTLTGDEIEIGPLSTEGWVLTFDGDKELSGDELYFEYDGWGGFDLANGSGEGLEIARDSYVTLYGAGDVVGIIAAGGGFVELQGAYVKIDDPLVIRSHFMSPNLPTCDATLEGALQYDDENNEFCGCNGTTWAPLDGAGTCE